HKWEGGAEGEGEADSAEVLSGAGAAFDLSRLCGSKTVQISQGRLVDWDHLLHDPGSPPCP
uniref:Uncharacterized protein n=2 Tax=Ailuropoda melanoleuca TaxID=9646 RepID=A0A7N5K114_AILME